MQKQRATSSLGSPKRGVASRSRVGNADKKVSPRKGCFQRAVSGEKITGLGLGLYIVRQIIEAHGGSVRVESSLQKGALFIVELPS
jgi:signal transduction histidine kinase